ncbi:MAG: NAD(P)-dependent oxidoreductase [Ruminococcus sp.]|nr:NAD(P)-dependent oxidoreductase [Ruminococcus sp.]
MKNVVLTGATGFLGRHLAEDLCAEGFRVYAVIRPDSKNAALLPKNERIVPMMIPLTKISSAEALRNIPIDGFFHFAWPGVNREQIGDDTIHLRAASDSVEVLQSAVELGCRKFVFAGSRSEYGIRNGPFSEDAVCAPGSPYGAAKLAFANRAREICESNDIQFIHARIFSVYGSDDHPWSLIYSSVRGMLKNEPLDFSAGMHYWNFMYISDMTDLILTIYNNADRIRKADNCIFNIATDDIRRLRGFIEEMYAVTGSSSILNFGGFQQSAESAMSVIPDTAKVKGMFDWKPRTAFSDGIRKMIAAMKEAK